MAMEYSQYLQYVFQWSNKISNYIFLFLIIKSTIKKPITIKKNLLFLANTFYISELFLPLLALIPLWFCSYTSTSTSFSDIVTIQYLIHKEKTGVWWKEEELMEAIYQWSLSTWLIYSHLRLKSHFLSGDFPNHPHPKGTICLHGIVYLILSYYLWHIHLHLLEQKSLKSRTYLLSVYPQKLTNQRH